MAFAAIIPLSASAAAPLAVRVVESRRHKHPAVASAVHFALRRATVSYQLRSASRFCCRSVSSTSSPRSSDEKFLRVLQSEIDDLEQSKDFDKNVELPENFPFKVEDNVGKQTVTLTGEYGSETITIKVSILNLKEEEDEEEDDEEVEDESTLALVVTISKKDGLSLVFKCSASEDECIINSLSLKNPETDDQLAYEGPDFLDLDVNLQKAFQRYLFVRGIEPITVAILQDYMMEKDNKEYHRWLKNLKKFVEA